VGEPVCATPLGSRFGLERRLLRQPTAGVRCELAWSVGQDSQNTEEYSSGWAVLFQAAVACTGTLCPGLVFWLEILIRSGSYWSAGLLYNPFDPTQHPVKSWVLMLWYLVGSGQKKCLAAVAVNVLMGQISDREHHWKKPRNLQNRCLMWLGLVPVCITGLVDVLFAFTGSDQNSRISVKVWDLSWVRLKHPQKTVLAITTKSLSR
jgi:hypothetical protein